MKKIIISFFVLIILLLSCEKTNEEKLNTILSSDSIEIKFISYGGIAGRMEQSYHVVKNDIESVLIMNKGSEYQNFIRISDERKLLHEFINECYKTHDPNKDVRGSCFGTGKCEYIFKSRHTELNLKPSTECDSIFRLLFKVE